MSHGVCGVAYIVLSNPCEIFRRGQGRDVDRGTRPVELWNCGIVELCVPSLVSDSVYSHSADDSFDPPPRVPVGDWMFDRSVLSPKRWSSRSVGTVPSLPNPYLETVNGNPKNKGKQEKQERRQMNVWKLKR